MKERFIAMPGNTKRGALALIVALLAAMPASAQITTTTPVSRLDLAHPDLGHIGGSTLHTKVRDLYEKIGDNMDSRYEEFTAVADSAVTTVAHNFNIPFADLNVILWSGVGSAKTRIADPVGAGWTIAATAGFVKTKIDVTAPSSGGPHDFSVEIHSGLKSMSVQAADAVAITGGSVSGVDLYSDVVQNLLYFEEPSGSDRVSIAAPSLAAPYSLTLPVDDGAPGQVLETDGDGGLAWVDVTTDLDGLTDVTVSGVADQDVLKYNGSQWVNQQSQAVSTFAPPGVQTDDYFDLGNPTDEGQNFSFSSTNGPFQSFQYASYPGDFAEYTLRGKMGNGNAPNGSIVCDLYATTAPPTEAVTGPSLSTSNTILMADIAAIAPYGGSNTLAGTAPIKFSFTPVTLVDNTRYAVKCQISGGSPAPTLWVALRTANHYPNGYGPIEGFFSATWDTRFSIGFATAQVAGDANRVIRTNSDGLLDDSFLAGGADFSVSDLTGINSLQFRETDINGGSSVTLNIPSLSSSYSLTLPPDDGVANAVLTTDGSGVLSWANNIELVKQTRPISAVGASTSGVAENVTATPLTLTAGTWDISGSCGWSPNGISQTMQERTCAISLTSATLPPSDAYFVPTAGGEYMARFATQSFPATAYASEINGIAIPTYRVTLGSTTTFYLISYAIHNNLWYRYGWFEARRVSY